VSQIEEGIAALEDYLRRYPSGHFAELAQVRLDKLLALRGEKRITPIAPPTPFSQGTVAADTDFRVGDWYTRAVDDLLLRTTRSSFVQVLEVSDLRVVFSNGHVTDRIYNTTFDPNGNRVIKDIQTFATEYFLGRKWVSRYRVTMPDGATDDISIDWKVVKRETINVPAGSFTAFLVDGQGWSTGNGRRRFTYWIAPDKARLPLVFETRWWDARNVPWVHTASRMSSFREQSRQEPQESSALRDAIEAIERDAQEAPR
jgi:hypothetical protein